MDLIRKMAEKQGEKCELKHESVKAAAESMGINNLSEEAASLLAEDATYRIKQARRQSRYDFEIRLKSGQSCIMI